jgi:methanogenic corrinoid protein MtbC1
MSGAIMQHQAAYFAALCNGDEAAARAVVDNLRAIGVNTTTIYFDVFAPSMQQIGELWERNQITVAEEHLATAITERMIGQLSLGARLLAQHEQGVVLVGCVAGERHELGLRMLADLLRQAGWRVLYLGGDVPTADWVQLAVRTNADAVAISAGAQRFLPALRSLVSQLRAALPNTLVLVGGAMFVREPELWQAVGATLYDVDPVAAVERLTVQRGQTQAR